MVRVVRGQCALWYASAHLCQLRQIGRNPWCSPQDQGLNEFIAREGNTLVTDSRAVTLAFGKRHKNVLQSIEKKRASLRPMIAEHAGLNFQPGIYADENGQRRPMYHLTAEGLTELTMGFSGDDACEVRILFIEAFKELAGPPGPRRARWSSNCTRWSGAKCPRGLRARLAAS